MMSTNTAFRCQQYGMLLSEKGRIALRERPYHSQRNGMLLSLRRAKSQSLRFSLKIAEEKQI